MEIIVLKQIFVCLLASDLVDKTSKLSAFNLEIVVAPESSQAASWIYDSTSVFDNEISFISSVESFKC